MVPQFTLYADASRGRRPDFTRAMEPEAANALFAEFTKSLSQFTAQPVECGVFGAHMEVELVNDGPFTMMLERRAPAG